jgi:fructose-specific phosphotransferase system IIA component
MRLSNYLTRNLILLDLPAASKDDALARMVDLLAAGKLVSNRDEFLAEVHKRDGQGSTAIGHGMAIPHARSRTLERIVVAMARLQNGVEFGAEDGTPVRLIFLLGTPIESAGEYLKVLGRLSKLLKENGLRQELLKAASPAEVLELLEKTECRLPGGRNGLS